MLEGRAGRSADRCGAGRLSGQVRGGSWGRSAVVETQSTTEQTLLSEVSQFQQRKISNKINGKNSE